MKLYVFKVNEGWAGGAVGIVGKSIKDARRLLPTRERFKFIKSIRVTGVKRTRILFFEAYYE